MKRIFMLCKKCAGHRQHTLSEDKKHYVCRQCGNRVAAK